jgi:hypothetical protein
MRSQMAQRLESARDKGRALMLCLELELGDLCTSDPIGGGELALKLLEGVARCPERRGGCLHVGTNLFEHGSRPLDAARQIGGGRWV